MASQSVTVCVATFGDDSYWGPLRERAVASVLAQTVVPEVVVYHDSDPDQSRCGPARNAAAERATTDGLLFLDADDTLGPHCIEYLLAEHGDIRVPAISCQRVDGSWTDAKPLKGPRGWVIGSLIRRADFVRLGGFRDRVWGEDSEFWLRCQLSGLRFSHSSDAVYRIGYRPESRKTYKWRDGLWSKIQTEAREEFSECRISR